MFEISSIATPQLHDQRIASSKSYQFEPKESIWNFSQRVFLISFIFFELPKYSIRSVCGISFDEGVFHFP